MRTTTVLRAAALLCALVACQPRDDSAEDSMSADSTPVDDATPDPAAAANDTPPSTTAPARGNPPADAKRSDSALPPEDTVRAMRPKLPEVVPDSRPGRWRGFKLPEERPVRIPVETLRRLEPAPDSTMKGDSTKPPKP